MEFRGVMGPVTPVKVETEHGVLTFGYRSVVVFDKAGKQVASFSCEDDPGDFDSKALEEGWTRVGDSVNPDGSFPMIPVKGTKAVPAAGVAPERTAGEIAGSLAGNTAKLGCMLVLLVFILVMFFGCVSAFTRH